MIKPYKFYLTQSSALSLASNMVVGICSIVTILAGAEQACAQVAPTQVNQKAVDDFGLDRKTGRFVWSSGDLIRIGGDNGVGLAIDADAKYSSSSWPNIISNYDFSVNAWNRTVSYFGDSQTFVGASTYVPEYPVGSSLTNISGGFLFTDRHGVQIYFTGATRKIVHPDGREYTYDNGFWKTNFGYMLKLGSSPLRAVNQAVDYCSENISTPCAPLTENRTASISGPTAGQYTLIDAMGGQTLIRGTLMVAKQWRQTSVYTPPDEYLYYPLGITLPGSASEDVTITYKAINPSFETHDDIWATSIKRDDLTANYTYLKANVGGQGQMTPSTAYTLSIAASVSGQKIYDSFAVKPSSGYGRSRRTLAHITDPLGRRTGFLYNAAVEVSGINYPNTRTVKNEYDSRNNIIRSISQAAASSSPDLITTYTYASSCSLATQASCNKPLTVIDPNGNVTEYTYNARGQVLTQTFPAPTAGAARPQITNTYSMRTAYIKDASGNAIAAGAPISLLTQSSTCRTLAACAATTDEVTTTYDYGPLTGLNNLNLRGIGVTAADNQGQMTTSRTCFQYNYFGEKIATTQPNAGFTSCN